METRSLAEGLSIGGQPQHEDFAALAEQGFRTVVNLRTDEEDGTLPGEQHLVEEAGLNYAAIPISPQVIDDGAVQRFSQAVSSVDSQPAFIHCKSGGRAGLLTLMHLAIQNGWGIEQALQEGQKQGIAPGPTSPYRAFFEDFLRRHSPGERA